MDNHTVRITLRLPSDLHKQIEALAKQEERSLNWKMLNLMKMGIEKQAQLGEGTDKPH